MVDQNPMHRAPATLDVITLDCIKGERNDDLMPDSILVLSVSAARIKVTRKDLE